MPVLYLVRRAWLQQEYELEFYKFKEFANSDFDQPNDQPHADDFEASPEGDSDKIGGDDSWFAVLGVAKTATIEDVKAAYKALIKQIIRTGCKACRQHSRRLPNPKPKGLTQPIRKH